MRALSPSGLTDLDDIGQSGDKFGKPSFFSLSLSFGLKIGASNLDENVVSVYLVVVREGE